MSERQTLRLAGVELYFADLQAAKEFYRDVLGLHIAEEDPRRYAKFESGPAFVCLEKKGVESYPSLDKAVLFFEVSDLATRIAALGERVLEQGPAGGPPQWAVIHDSEGHNVLLLQAAEAELPTCSQPRP